MSDKISFRELISRISSCTDRNRQFSRTFMAELTKAVEAGLNESGSVTISGFGKFELRWMKERRGTHPQTGEKITIPGQNKVVFKPYKPLREHVNRSYINLKPQVLNDSSKEPETDRPVPSLPTPADEDHDLIRVRDIHPPDPGNRSGPPVEIPVSASASSETLTDTDATDRPGSSDRTAANSGKQSGAETTEAVVSNDSEEFIFERPSPVDTCPDPGTPTRDDDTQDPKKRPASASPEPIFGDPETDTPRKTFNWSYVAVTALLMLVVLFALFSTRETEPETVGITDPAPAETVEIPSVEELRTNSIEESGFIVIITENGQTLWELAGEYTGDSYLWPWIYHLNNNIGNPDIIRAGADLTIPVPSDKNDLSTTELREVAAGYIRVYEWYKEQNAETARYYLWAAGAYDPALLDEPDRNFDQSDIRFARNR